MVSLAAERAEVSRSETSEATEPVAQGPVGSGPVNLWRDAGPTPEPPPEEIETDGPSPKAFATDVRLATDVFVYDTWSGLGKTHTVLVALHRSGDTFRYEAKVSAHPNGVGEPILDPGVTRHQSGASCICSATSACGCEVDAGATRKEGKVPAAPVLAFLSAFGTRPLDLRQKHVHHRDWSDDYPFLHVAAVVRGAPVVHFTADDQHRHWKRDGHYLYRLPEEQRGPMEPEHGTLMTAFANLERAIGVGPWIAEQHKRDPNAGAL